MRYGRARKYTDRSRLALCTAERTRRGKPTGQRCGNKACTNTRLCHVHTPGRRQKRRTPCPLLVHLFYLYGMWNCQMDAIERHWKWMTARVFGGLVPRASLQSHDNRYRRYMEAHPAPPGARALERVYARKAVGGVHRYEEFNMDNLVEHIAVGSVVDIHGVPYRFTESGPQRCDAVGHGMPQDFCTLFALNGYTWRRGAWELHDSMPAAGPTELQKACIARCFDLARTPVVKPEPVDDDYGERRGALLDALAHAWFLHALTVLPAGAGMAWVATTVFADTVDADTLREHASRYAAWRAAHFPDPVFDAFLATTTAFVHRCIPYVCTPQGVARRDVPVRAAFVPLCAVSGYVWRDGAWELHPQLAAGDVDALQQRCQALVFQPGGAPHGACAPPQNGA
jgi:hypothetical protein